MDDVLLYTGLAVLVAALIAIRITNSPGRRASPRAMEWILGVAGAGSLSVLASGIISSSSLESRIFTIVAGAVCALVIFGTIITFSRKGSRQAGNHNADTGDGA